MSSSVPAGSDHLELTIRLGQQELVAGFAGFILQAEEIQPILDEAARVAAAGMGGTLSKVLRHLPEENCFLVAAGVGWHKGVVGHARLDEELESPAGYAFLTGEPVICNHLGHETRFKTPALLAEHGVTRALNVLIAGPGTLPRTPEDDPHDFGTRFGVLEVDSTSRGEFTQADTAFLRAMAGLLANALIRHNRTQAAAEARDLLMLEIHHRIKNSLQLVQNLLSLQARATEDEQAANDLIESASRVRTIALIHDRLYHTGAALTVEVGAYLNDLVEGLRGAMASTLDGRSIRVVSDTVVWPAADVTTLGLVLTELVTNALKYGEGEVSVSFRQRPGCNGILTVRDEGTGLPDDFTPDRGRGLGMRLVGSMLKGEGAGLRIDRTDPHTCFVAILPPERKITR